MTLGRRNVIFHIDVNSAFLSWEAVYRLHHLGGKEDLREKVSAVGGDMAMRHGIILAKSIPAKKFHIKTGETILEAKQKCPELILVPPNYGLYEKCSKAFMDILRRYSPTVEQYSIDEAFVDMTGTEGLWGDAVTAAYRMKDQIRDMLGFTVNIGISENKLLAKMASDFQKPDRVHTLWREEIPDKMKLNYDGHYDMWQFASDGKVPGITGNVDLNVYYASTVVKRYFVSYNANGGTNPPVDTTAYEKGASIPLKGQENMKREGYSFTGWNTKPDGSGTSYAAGSSYPNVSGSLVLYAQWKKLDSITIQYDANGGEKPPTDSTTYYAGQTAIVAEAGEMFRNGYTFSGWNTKANGTGTAYRPGVSIPNLKKSLTLYAQWKNNTSESSKTDLSSVDEG